MKRILIYITSLLLLAGIATAIPAFAVVDDEPKQDAMYIYRNDGKFHGFFNAEVVRMEFSMIDTLGNKHHDYVTQEIETLDSIYRIPISAIDSVSFYTPRTEYIEDVKATTTSSLWDYVVASDSVSWITLSSSLPADLMPSVGDKLCTTKSRNLLPGGFYGTVRKITATAAGTRLECENEGLTSYLKRHIFKSGIQVNEDEQSLERRRRMERRGAPDSPSVVRETLDPIVFEQELEGEIELNDLFKLKGEFKAKSEITPTVYASAFCAIGMVDGANIDCSLYVNAKAVTDIEGKAAVEFSYDFPLSKRYIWITDTPFFIEIEPGMHFGMSGEIGFTHHEDVSLSAYASAAVTAGLGANRILVSSDAKLLSRTSETTATGVFTTNVGPYFAVNLLLGTEDIGKLGLRVEAGAKLQVTADINLDDPEAVDEVSTALYDRLSGDSSIKIGPYGQVGYNWKFLGEFEDEDNFWEYDPGWEFDGGLVPRFYRTNVYTSDASTGSITVESNVDGYVFIFTTGTLGFALFDDKGKEVARIFDTRNYLDPLLWNYYSLTFTGIEYNKWYTVHPVCHLMGHELIASPGVKFFAGERDLLVDPMSLEFDFNGGTKFISVKNSFSDETHYILENLPDDWLTVEQTEGGYNITVKPNETTKRRQTTITFTAADPNNPFNTRQREVVIKQDIDPELIGLLMQNYDITSETDDSDWPDFWVWTPYATEEEPNGRWDLFGLLPRIGKEDIEDAFKRNPKIKPNDDGTFKLEGEGLTIEGKFAPAPDGERYRTGSGTFTLSTDMQHHRKSKEDVEEMLHRGPNNGDIQDFNEFVNPALDEHYKRSVEGNIYISWSEHKQQYEFNFIGHGSVTYDAECYWEFRGLDPSFTESGTNVFYTAHPNATLGETKFVSVTCNNSIDCNVDYELVE